MDIREDIASLCSHFREEKKLCECYSVSTVVTVHTVLSWKERQMVGSIVFKSAAFGKIGMVLIFSREVFVAKDSRFVIRMIRCV